MTSKSPFRRPVLEAAAYTIGIMVLVMITRLAMDIPVNITEIAEFSMRGILYWSGYLSIAFLSIFAFKYWRSRDLAGTGSWLLRACILYALMMIFGLGFGILKPLRNELIPFFADPPMVWLDRVIHFGFDPWQTYRWVVDTVGYLAIDHIYGVWWFYVSVALIAITAGLETNEHIRMGLQRAYFLIWAVMGLGIATIFMSAGPVFYERIGGDATYADWRAYVTPLDYEKTRAFHTAERLWQRYTDRELVVGAGISAFPSIHVAMAALATCYAFTINRVVGIAGTVWLFVMQVGSVVLGWHYAIDGYFSILVTVLLWIWLVPKAHRKGRFPIIRSR